MFNRRQINQLQFGAGEKYRNAHDATTMSMGGTMDFDKVRGGSGIASPALQQLQAADIIDEAEKLLYNFDLAMIHRVCAQGFTIEQVAKQMYDEQFDGAWQSYLTEAGRKFRQGLDQLADMWWPDSKVKKDPKTGEEIRPMRSMMTERATSTDAEAVPVSSKVAHATRDKVYRSGEKRRERA